MDQIYQESDGTQCQRLEMLKNFRIKKSSEETLSVDPGRKQLNVGKRIKQNLKNIVFEEDSDEDLDWTNKSTNPNHMNLTVSTIEPLGRKVLPRRQVAPTKIVINDDSEDDWDML